MSTRGAFGFVRYDAEKLTYNHCDSYPSGLGLDILRWAKNVLDWNSIRAQVDDLTLVDEQVKPTAEEAIKFAMYTDDRVSSGDDWYSILRNTQGDPQSILNAGAMIDSHGFLTDSLFCEWAYIVDFDTNSLDVYRGFQTSPPKAGRWAAPERIAAEQAAHDAFIAKNPHMKSGGRYYAVGLNATWSLVNLPTEEEFLLTLTGEV
jgi:hypothetical protein